MGNRSICKNVSTYWVPSFIIHCVVLAVAYPTKKKNKNEVSSFIHSKVIEGWVPKFKKVGHVTLDTPILGLFIIHCGVLAMVDLTKKKRTLASSVEKVMERGIPKCP